MSARNHALWALAVIFSIALLVGPALWNGFPLLQYDTGGYLARWYEGTLVPSRAVVYGLILNAGEKAAFWPVVLVQAALTVWVVALMLRAHGMGRRPWLLLGVIAALTAISTLPWLTSILLTDIFAGLGVLALYLLLLRPRHFSRSERFALIALIAVSAATHSATIAVLVALILSGVLVWLIQPRQLPLARTGNGVLALALGCVLVFAADFVVAKRLAWTPGGFALSFGRMLQDGIVNKYLDDHCPNPKLMLCAYKDQLPDDADVWFWGSPLFDKLGRFAGLGQEMAEIAVASVIDYPGLQLKTAATATARQLIAMHTGEGVLNSIWHTYGTIRRFTPQLVAPMEAARQQHGEIYFTAINQLDYPVALLSMALLPIIVLLAWRRTIPRPFGEFAAVCAIALLANAFVCGAMSNPHDRYGARLVWIAIFAVTISLVPLADRLRSSWIVLDRGLTSPKLPSANSMLGGVVTAHLRTLSLALLLACGGASAVSAGPAMDAVKKELVPTGTLRVAIAVAPQPSALYTLKDDATGKFRGVPVDLGSALAKKLGVPVEFLPHLASGEIQNEAASGKWDVTFMPVDEERKKFVDFGNAYHLLQSTYLVAPGSKLTKVEEANEPSVRIGGVANTTTFRAAQHAAPKATFITVPGVDAAIAAMKAGEIDCIALSRESLFGLATKIPGSRVLDGGFLNSSTAVAVPKGKAAALAYVSQFIEEAKASGLVRKAFDDVNLKNSQVAPAGMKP